MNKLHFRILYREFLFRVVDLEVLSSQAQGDASKILGQFAALLVLFGGMSALGLLFSADTRIPREVLLVRLWGTEHFVISITMLVVGLFAILSWDATFPDRRDLMVLAPLPVLGRTLFLAKIAASATALGVAVVALNGLLCPAWGIALAPPTTSVFDLLLTPELYRTIAAWGITVTLAGGFVYGSMLCVQGLAAQTLSRRQFLRVSALLQIAAFGLLILGFFLQPWIAAPKALAAAENQRALAWSPTYWFLGLFQQLNGTMHPALTPLARRAWAGLTIVGLGTVAAYLLSYFRTMRKIVEEPDIVPGSRKGAWLPAFGNSLATAVVQFSVRTLMRSRQHRLILSFYLGIGFAITILFLKTSLAKEQLSTPPHGSLPNPLSGPMLISSILMLIAWMAGTRVVFALPLDLRANWVFRIMPISGGAACLAARRRAVAVLAVAPMWAASAVAFAWIWPWTAVAGHAVILGLFGLLLGELGLLGTQKIPFTCSYLPGRSNFHITFGLSLGIIVNLLGAAAQFEFRALGDPARFGLILITLGIAVGVARWQTSTQVREEDAHLEFEEGSDPVIMRLGLEGPA
jgi:hypothetical protein